MQGVGGVRLTGVVEVEYGDVVLVLSAPGVYVGERVIADVVRVEFDG